MVLSTSSALHWLFFFQNTHYPEDEEGTESQDKEMEEGEKEKVCDGICLT